MAIFIDGFKAYNYLKHILQPCLKYRKIFSYSKISNRGLKNNLTLEFILFKSNYNFSTKLSSAFTEVDNLQLNKYFNYLTDSYKNRKGKEDFDDILNTREVLCLIQERMKIYEDLKSLEELANQDKDMKEIAQEEKVIYMERLKNLESELIQMILLNIGRDDCSDIILEINAGVGGQESMLFAKDLLEMYIKYMDYLGFNYDLINLDVSDQGGVPHASIAVSGKRVMEIMRHEGGVHRVQRVPATEKSGRIHTSVVSVAVLPQPNEIEVVLHDKDLKIETKRATGAGGQHVNTTDSAVRITHIPTGTVVECQTQRSQIQNKNTAMLKLRAKIYQKMLTDSLNATSKVRRQQKGLGLRNEKIRTYNYNQNRVTDHRLSENGTTHNLRGFMEGGEVLSEFHNRLQYDFQKSALLEAIRHVNSR